MKKLFLVRHAKSSWSDPQLSDMDRPLNERGKRDAPEMGSRLFDNKIYPDLMISSPAKRARSTAKKISKIIGYPNKEILLNDALYHGEEQEILNLIKSVDDAIESLMIFGHNPGFTDFANDLCNINIYNIPTCGIVGIKFEVEKWKDVEFRTGELMFFDYPKKTPVPYNII